MAAAGVLSSAPATRRWSLPVAAAAAGPPPHRPRRRRRGPAKAVSPASAVGWEDPIASAPQAPAVPAVMVVARGVVPTEAAQEEEVFLPPAATLFSPPALLPLPAAAHSRASLAAT